MGDSGEFCKHVVATALEVAGSEPKARRPARASGGQELDCDGTCRGSSPESLSNS